MAATGFVPPPYPHDRLTELRATADAVPGGIVDCSVGTPVDPMPEIARRALADTAAAATGYPAAVGALAYREAAAAWIGRRFGVSVAPEAVVACVGTKELVASLPRVLALRDPSRDTVPAGIPPSAGALVDRAGLKGAAIGRARVSTTHANFIVNEGGATAAEIRELIDRCKAEVTSRFGVRLREEIVYLGFD